MASLLQNSSLNTNSNFNSGIQRPKMKERPADYKPIKQEHDKVRNSDLITKTKIKIETALNTPGYAYRGLKGDPDYNFFEQLRVSKIPYYLGGIGLAAVCMAGRNILDPDCVKGNQALFKKVALGALFYYAARAIANAAIDIPIKIFRGVDLNLPYRKITALREANPMNLPNNKKPSNQKVFESAEFTRWDLLYKDGKTNSNETFDKIAKKFGVTQKQNDSDSKVMSKIRKLIIMATSWKYMLAVPFVTTGLGLAQQKAFEGADYRDFFKTTLNLLNPQVNNKWHKFKNSFKGNIIKPVGEAFVQLWQGNSKASKIFGRTAILASVGLAVLANAMIMSKTSLKDDDANKIMGGTK